MKNFNEIYQKTYNEVKNKMATQVPKKFYQQTYFKVLSIIGVLIFIFSIMMDLALTI